MWWSKTHMWLVWEGESSVRVYSSPWETKVSQINIYTPEDAKCNRPPTKCYIHALHARIALLEDQLAQSRHGTNDRPTLSNILEEPKSPPPTGFPQYNSKDLPFFGLESRASSAYGHLGFFRKFDEVPEASHQRKITINDGVLLIEKSPFFLQPGLQSQLLEDFWTWQNTWPLLIHEPLFRKDLSDNCAGGYCSPTLLASCLPWALIIQISHSLDVPISTGTRQGTLLFSMPSHQFLRKSNIQASPLFYRQLSFLRQSC